MSYNAIHVILQLCFLIIIIDLEKIVINIKYKSYVYFKNYYFVVTCTSFMLDDKNFSNRKTCALLYKQYLCS